MILTMSLSKPNSMFRQARSCFRRLQRPCPFHYSPASRLLSTLAVLEQREGKLNVSSLAAVTAAAKLGGSTAGFVAGSNIKAVAEEAAKVKGLDKIIFVENGDYDKVYPSSGLPGVSLCTCASRSPY